MAELAIAQLTYREPRHIGTISSDGSLFTYDPAYLAQPDATAISLSLPLREEPYRKVEYQPYFEGLLPEGFSRQALVAELQLREGDWLSLLAACGNDCIGDVLVIAANDNVRRPTCYQPIDQQTLKLMFQNLPAIAEQNAEMRLSLAGAQGKTGLAHDPAAPMSEGWLQPQGLAATTHILKTSPMRDIPEIEFLCMKAAQACGIEAANVSLLDFANPVIAVERFDRQIVQDGNGWHVERLHQEDVCQAFGMTSGSKYAELDGGSIHDIAVLLRAKSVRPARDIAAFAQQLLFNYVIGNCDAHLKNFSLLYRKGSVEGRPVISLSPAYDLVCTTYFPKYSRDMAMKMGGAHSIDDVTVGTLSSVAHELGITVRALQTLAAPIAGRLLPVLEAAGDGAMGDILESTPYIAEDLAKDFEPRLEVLRKFCEG